MRDGLPPEPQFGPAEELQRDPDQPPRRNLLWPVLAVAAVVAAGIVRVPL